jgi:predicted transcriptional regulator
MYNYKLSFNGVKTEDLYKGIKGRDSDEDYLNQARKALSSRDKWYGFAVIDLIDAKLKINELNRRIKELEGDG